MILYMIGRYMGRHWPLRYLTSLSMTGYGILATAENGITLTSGVSHPKLLAVVDYMEQGLEEPLSQTDDRKPICQPDSLNGYSKYLSTTPTRYSDLRLARARHQFRQTSMSILSIALACGFCSLRISQNAIVRSGRTPRAERQPETAAE